ncbi:MAG: Ig-like domain-containing protein [Lachnospiraceae bacterium]|nr:Ig-like domain-containing protein [Lachnospiraceae bacterium]
MKRKWLSVVLMLLLLVASVVPGKVFAASTPKLNKAKAMMEVDSKLTLKLGDIAATDVKWSSSNKKVAIVSSKGVITAKAEGTATIKAKYNSKTYSCKVTVVDSNKKENKIETYIKDMYGSTKYKVEQDGIITEIYAQDKSLIFSITTSEFTDLGLTKEEIEEAAEEVFSILEETMEELLEDLKENTYKDAKLVFRIYDTDNKLLYERVL